MCVLVLCCLFCFKQKNKVQNTKPRVAWGNKIEFLFKNLSTYFLLHNVYTHDTHRERVDTYMATCYIYIYTYHKMTTCVFAQTSLHMLYAKINLENSQLSKQHVKTTLQYAANSFHKTWRFPEAVISILFQHRRWGQGHRLSGSTPPIFRWDRSRSQSKTVWLMFLSLNQAVSSLLALSEGLLWLGHLPNHVRCCISDSRQTKSYTRRQAKVVSPLPFTKAILADSLSI